MGKQKSSLVRPSFIGEFLLFFSRARTGFGYFRVPLRNLLKWLFLSKETTNFTYDLEEINKRYLASLLAEITNKNFEETMCYIKELDADSELRKHIKDVANKRGLRFIENQEVSFGRRIGWYVFARALKPKVIVETGVYHGLGSCVLTAALRRNHQEGYAGQYFGTDINPEAGVLLSGEYAGYGRILYGDSIESLKKLDGLIDLFINDSDHSAEYEEQEYMTIAKKISKFAVILGDNSHCTDKLLEFSLETDRNFVFFQEKPRQHWYSGAGIGISFKRQ